MVLTTASVIPYLVDRRLLTVAMLLNEPLEALAFVSRNRGFRVSFSTGHGVRRGWWVKQVKQWDRSGIESFEQEARCYWLAREQAEFAVLGEVLPRCEIYDPEPRILVLELIRTPAAVVEATGAAALGKAMRRYQEGIGAAAARQAGFRSEVPWALTLAEPHEARAKRTSQGNRALLDILKRYPDFAPALRQLRRDWRGVEAKAFVHGDMKLENCLVKGERVWLLDWEMAAWGDPAWDAGGLLQSYWTQWIGGRASQGEVRVASRAFWKAYAAGEDPARLEQTVRYAAARMIQTAWERLQRSPGLRDDALKMLQLSQNVFQNPPRAVEELVAS